MCAGKSYLWKNVRGWQINRGKNVRGWKVTRRKMRACEKLPAKKCDRAHGRVGACARWWQITRSWKITGRKMRVDENYPRKNAPGFRGYENKPRTRAHFRGHPRISAGNRAYEHPPFLSNAWWVVLGKALYIRQRNVDNTCNWLV